MTSLSVQQLARNAPCRREYGGCGALPGESCVRTCSGKTAYYPHRDRLDQLPELSQEVTVCSACGNPDEVGQYRHGWCRACLRRWYRAGRPESGPPPLHSKYARIEAWRSILVPVVSREVSRLEQGIAAEHLVCADLLLQGYSAFMTDQSCSYDVAVDVGRLIRVQVKSTLAPRMSDGRAVDPVYRFMTRRSTGRADYAEDAFDLFALVALDIRRIAYLTKSFWGQWVNVCHPDSRVNGKHFTDFPLAKAVADLGPML